MLVSIIIPMYNSELTIEECIHSVIKQTYNGEIEIIVVNDGSKDKSQEIVESIIKYNKSKILIKLIDKENGGVSSARNVGMKNASGNFIALLDSDDFWAINKLERQIEIFSKYPEIDFLGTNRNNEHFNRFLLKKFDDVTFISAKFLLLKWFFVTPTVMFKRKVFDSVGGFDESQKYAEEGNYWLRVCNENCCALLNESLVTTGNGKPHFGYSGLSGNLKGMQKGEYKNLKDGLNLGIINKIEYGLLFIYSSAKYLRRLLIVKMRN
ncbi:benzoate transporter [Flavobacterium aquidurense]|uniref:glycosyltransferase family 2 protein n=1 Tax=Flavobacterium aquidurense TaxID=362413 RepID=UPI000913335F|nr:glycosyltransferase family A protein [Flavobacterium aquidurense]OXA71477.1 benzoate transporter [Flavobacterium aquidurense]SHG95490.1 Glycosyltransferase involved in cell wall bisynthesis [Flavobacterium frigidimaris]